MPTIGHRGVAMLDFPRTPKIFQKRTHLTHNSYMGHGDDAKLGQSDQEN